jgi:hypothetical protein
MMASPDVFMMALADLQPSQLYISAEKLAHLEAAINFSNPEEIPPIPVKDLNGVVIMTDGHTRALAAWRAGLTRVPVFWDTDELDWEAYQICVDWCRNADIFSAADLAGRVISSEDYAVLWLERCRVMQQRLAESRHHQG